MVDPFFISNETIRAGMSLSAARRALIAAFKQFGLETPDLDARLLIMEAANLNYSDLVAQGQIVLSDEIAMTLNNLAMRRLSGEPIDSIQGYREFYGRRFEISQDVLSPRPETEGLVDDALKLMADIKAPRILDLGTGSGAVLITLLAECEHAVGVGADISVAALTIANNNASDIGVSDRLTWAQSDWFSAITGTFDLIVSNPPYITDAAMLELSREVADFDPDLSLRGGQDGLSAYATILSKAFDFLVPGGSLIVEIGYDQGASVAEMFTASGFQNVTVSKDLSGHDRIVAGAAAEIIRG